MVKREIIKNRWEKKPSIYFLLKMRNKSTVESVEKIKLTTVESAFVERKIYYIKLRIIKGKPTKY